jgi:succinate dehydrogenase / fumarate reductase iron-sulfur subunit
MRCITFKLTALPDLAVRWNCKAGKCGSSSAEVTAAATLGAGGRSPLKTSLAVTGKHFQCSKIWLPTSWNYRVNKKDSALYAGRRTSMEDGSARSRPRAGVSPVRRYFLCQNVCHVLRDHEKHEQFGGPRFFVRIAGLEMHPLDNLNRTALLKDELGIGYCNITKCCTEVCPEDIHITDNAIIPLKERVVDDFYDPVRWFLRKLSGKK